MLDWLFAWLQNAIAWFWSFVVGMVLYVLGALADLAVAIFSAFLAALGALIAAVPVPDFLTHGLGSLFSALSPGVLYFLGVFQVPAGLAMIGSAVAFRLLRKAVTLFQW